MIVYGTVTCYGAVGLYAIQLWLVASKETDIHADPKQIR